MHYNAIDEYELYSSFPLPIVEKAKNVLESVKKDVPDGWAIIITKSAVANSGLIIALRDENEFFSSWPIFEGSETARLTADIRFTVATSKRIRGL